MSTASEREIVSSRIFSASPALVFTAWTDPVHLASWWGPAGFTNTFHEFDLRPGGTWRFTMHGPEKGHYQNECVFTRIEPPHLLSWERASKPLFDVVATFEEVAPGRTKVLFRQIFPSVEDCNKVRPFVPEKNEENFDRLEAELEKMKTLNDGQ